MTEKTSVYQGEVLGFRVARLFRNRVELVSVEFASFDDAERYADDTNSMSTLEAIYFPIKITSMHNAVIKEKSFD